MAQIAVPYRNGPLVLGARHRSELASCGLPLPSSSLFAKGPPTHNGRTEAGDRLVFRSGGCAERAGLLGQLWEKTHMAGTS